MTAEKFNLRLTKQERSQLKKIVFSSGMTITDYIRQRLFYNNPDISDQNIIYETPIRDKHNYLTANILQNIYLLILHLMAEGKSTEEMIEIKNRCKEHAEKNIVNFGYLKVRKDE